MNRKEYIDALDGVYKRVKELRDAFGLIRLTDAEPMEDDRRKKSAKKSGTSKKPGKGKKKGGK